jgi:hypothetical protein
VELTRIEKMAFLGLLARDRELQQQRALLQVDERELIESAEHRLELPKGSIGSTHDVNLDTGAIVERVTS